MRVDPIEIHALPRGDGMSERNNFVLYRDDMNI